LFSLAVSPDRQWLAYLVLNREQKQQNLMVVSTQGEQLKSITMSLNFSKILEWLTDDRLAISRWRQDENGAQLLDSTVIFNPFTGEQWELVSDDYPGIYSSIRPIVHWLDRYYNRTVYDPSLTRVIFAGLDEDGTPILLVDMRTKQVLGKISWKGYFYGTTPQWSPDGQQVLVSGPAQLNQIDSSQNGIELFSLTRDGQITRLTHLTDVYPALVYNFRWSPDGQKVAFWVDLQESTLSGVLLAVLDVASGEVVNYCIPGEKVDPYSDNYVPPVWSPDSQQIAVASVLDEEQLPVTIIVDLVQGVATKVVENLIPMGWMVSPP
jgi:Tol biopolymer transport system component